MLKKLLSMVILAIIASTTAFAQSGSVSGTITDEDSGDTVPGVNIILVELNRGISTNADGEYTINNVPAGTYAVRATFIGYSDFQGSVTVGSGNTELNIALNPDVFGLDEVVVTGVIEGTPKKKLAFTVDNVSGDELELVTAGDAGSSLQGKIAGVQVTSANGAPGSAPSIRLRGSTSIGSTNGGNQEPLYIVDGVILSGSLADIPSNDIESIELVKGAAAASLYGSRAANGVVQIFTKRGQNLEAGKTTVTIRNQFGRSFLPEQIALSNNHVFAKTEAELLAAQPGANTADYSLDATNSYLVQTGSGNRVLLADNIQDNTYGTTYDLQEQIFDPGYSLNNYVSVARNFGNSNLAVSFTNNIESGVVKQRDGYNRQNARVNLDQYISDEITIGGSLSYSQSENDVVSQGPGSPFWGALFFQPNTDLYAPNEEDGSAYNIDADPYIIEDNPLYSLATSNDNRERTRTLGNLNFRYRPISQVLVEGQYSIDRTSQLRTRFTPQGVLNRGTPVTPGNGSLAYDSFDDVAENMSLTAGYNERFGDLTIRTKASYLYENSEYVSHGATASEFIVGNVQNFNATNPDGTRSLRNYNEQITSENIFGIVAFDYLDRYIVDVLVRRDGSSLFGEDERYQTYYRVSGAYRVSEDFQVDGINELKLRASYGTAGLRPTFAAQYLTYSISGGTITKNRLGNPNLKPATAAELELGLNVDFLDRFSLEAAYSNTVTEDQILDVPLSAAAGGYGSQWQNAGTLESNTFEASLRAIAIQERDMNLSFGLTFDRTRQKVTALSVPPFFQGSTTQNANVFFVAPGETFGVIYGRKFVTSLDQLSTAQQNSGNTYEVNSDGYVVTGLGTASESPVKFEEEDGNQIVAIGDVNPDFNMGFSTNFNYKGLSLYMLWNAKIGGDIYNQTKQWLFRENRAAIIDQNGKAEADKKPTNYYQGFYDANNTTQYFIEDGTYLKLREISVGYNFTRNELGSLGELFESVRVSVTGRNLLTFTDYSGYDPEVGGIGGDATNFAFDGFSYPNFRTVSGSLELRF
ncbi:MAG: SusC/RagA family TonB-linked outer membrane protein [Balneola sp.]